MSQMASGLHGLEILLGRKKRRSIGAWNCTRACWGGEGARERLRLWLGVRGERSFGTNSLYLDVKPRCPVDGGAKQGIPWNVVQHRA